MVEKELIRFQQEIGAIKSELYANNDVKTLDDEEKYTIATKIDLAVSRLIRLLEYKKES